MNSVMSKKTLILITIISCTLVIMIPTIYKVLIDHRNKLYLSVEKEIKEAAEKCWDEKKCQNETITLKELYSLDYLEKQIDPISKKVYEEDSLIKKINGKIELNLK